MTRNSLSKTWQSTAMSPNFSVPLGGGGLMEAMLGAVVARGHGPSEGGAGYAWQANKGDTRKCLSEGLSRKDWTTGALQHRSRG
jgi:hypothetical protein